MLSAKPSRQPIDQSEPKPPAAVAAADVHPFI